MPKIYLEKNVLEATFERLEIIFENFEKSIDDNLPINQILYYDKILEMFLDNDRIKLSNDDITQIESIIYNIDIIINKKFSIKNSKYKQLKSCVEVLKMK